MERRKIDDFALGEMAKRINKNELEKLNSLFEEEGEKWKQLKVGMRFICDSNVWDEFEGKIISVDVDKREFVFLDLSVKDAKKQTSYICPSKTW